MQHVDVIYPETKLEGRNEGKPASEHMMFESVSPLPSQTSIVIARTRQFAHWREGAHPMQLSGDSPESKTSRSAQTNRDVANGPTITPVAPLARTQRPVPCQSHAFSFSYWFL
jgi:hypothetical protein